MEENSSMSLLNMSYKNTDTEHVGLLLKAKTITLFENENIKDEQEESPIQENQEKSDNLIINKRSNSNSVKNFDPSPSSPSSSKILKDHNNNFHSGSSKKIDEIFKDKEEQNKETISQFRLLDLNHPSYKNILKHHTKKSIIKRDNDPVKKSKTVKFDLFSKNDWRKRLPSEVKSERRMEESDSNSSSRDSSESSDEEEVSGRGENKLLDYNRISVCEDENEISMNYPILSQVINNHSRMSKSIVVSHRSNKSNHSRHSKNNEIQSKIENTKNMIIKNTILQNSSKLANSIVIHTEENKENHNNNDEHDTVFFFNQKSRSDNEDEIFTNKLEEDNNNNDNDNDNNFLSDTINDFIAKERNNNKFTSYLKMNRSASAERVNLNKSSLSTNFRKNFKRSNNKKVIHKIAHQMRMKNIVTKVSAKEKFKIVFKKLRIILLFMYMIKRVKFYGLKIVREDIKREIERLNKLKYVNRRPENVLRKTKTVLRNDNVVEKKNSNIELLVETKRRCNFVNMKHFIINPEKNFMNYWNIILTMLILYTAIVSPYRTSFHDPPVYPSAWYFLEMLVDILFTLDFLINCFCGFYNHKNDLVMQWGDILLNYLKGWMIMDLLSIFPFQYVLDSEEDSNKSRKIGVTLNYLARLPRLFRLLKLFRIFRLLRLFKQNKFVKKYVKLIKLNGSVKRIISGLLIFVIFAHIFSCMWYFFAKMQDFDPDTWVFRSGLYDEDPGTLYFSCLYFTLSVLATLGYGDIIAYTNVEKFLVIILMVFGSMFISIIISNLVGAISHYDTYDSVQQEKINILNKFAHRNKLKNDLYLKIKKTFEDNSLNDLILDQDTLFKDLPYYLRVEIILHIQERNIKDIFFFREKNPNFVIEIIQNWKTVYYAKKDFIYFIDDKPQDVYFIIKGETSYMDDKGNKLTRFFNGSILGEVEIILGGSKRFLNLRAEENCDMNSVSGESFKQILSKFSNEFTSSMKNVKNKYKKYKEIMLGLDAAGSIDEKEKKECDTYKTTSSYLNYLKTLKRSQGNARIEWDSLESSSNSKLLRRKSSLELSRLSEGSGDKSMVSSRNWDKQSNNNIIDNKENNNNPGMIQLVDSNNSPNNAVSSNLQQNGSLIQPYFDVLDAVLNNPKDKIRQNPIATESEKRKLIEIVKTFDRFLDFLDIGFESFANLKYQVYELLNSNRQQTKTVEEVDKTLKNIEKNQEIIEANINHIY